MVKAPGEFRDLSAVSGHSKSQDRTPHPTPARPQGSHRRPRWGLRPGKQSESKKELRTLCWEHSADRRVMRQEGRRAT